MVWVGGLRKDSALFIGQLEALERAYPKAKRLVLIVDNYGFHKSDSVNAWLSRHPIAEFLFQPAYHPWVNRIERLWKALHDAVTRNHRRRTLEELCAQAATSSTSCNHSRAPGTRTRKWACSDSPINYLETPDSVIQAQVR